MHGIALCSHGKHKTHEAGCLAVAVNSRQALQQSRIESWCLCAVGKASAPATAAALCNDEGSYCSCVNAVLLVTSDFDAYL